MPCVYIRIFGNQTADLHRAKTRTQALSGGNSQMTTRTIVAAQQLNATGFPRNMPRFFTYFFSLVVVIVIVGRPVEAAGINAVCFPHNTTLGYSATHHYYLPHARQNFLGAGAGAGAGGGFGDDFPTQFGKPSPPHTDAVIK